MMKVYVGWLWSYILKVFGFWFHQAGLHTNGCYYNVLTDVESKFMLYGMEDVSLGFVTQDS